MAKQSGLGDRLFVSGYNLSGDIGSVNRIGGGFSPLPVTGIDKSGYERIGGVMDGAIDFTAFFNDALSQEHAALKGLPYTDVIMTYFRGATLGNPAAGLIAKQVNYDPTRGQDGSLTLAVNTISTAGYPLEWGEQLTAGPVTITGATSGTGVDFAAGTAFGASAYLHVSAFSGTDASVLIQASSDNAVGDPYAEPAGGMTFTQITSAPFSQRIVTGSTTAIERYVRQAVVTSGGFTSMTYAVMVVKHTTLQAHL